MCRIREECPKHGVRDAPLEAAHRLPTGLALCQLLPMVRPAARIAASLADGGHVHDLVEAAIAGEREPVADHLTTGGLDRGDPGVGGEVSLTRKPGHVAHDADDLGRQDRPHAEDLGERGARSLYLNFDAPVKFCYPPVQSAYVSHQFGGQPSTDLSYRVPRASTAQQLRGDIGRELFPDGIGEEIP